MFICKVEKCQNYSWLYKLNLFHCVYEQGFIQMKRYLFFFLILFFLFYFFFFIIKFVQVLQDFCLFVFLDGH